jgi:3-hydroxyisobutyrate dehydrogenase-like beta-hydroxyacid dehydrogenase
MEARRMKEKVGFMGLGIMGSAMAANIARAGYPLLVYNRSPGKTANLIALGAQEAATPKALATASDITFAMVTGPEALEALLWGADGAAEALGSGKTFINMSSVTPRFSKELASRLAPTGTVFIDAPVSGTKKPAQEGTLIILTGGPQEAVDRLIPLLQTMGKKVVYCGGAGQGSMMKMAINLLLGSMMEALAEMLNFGKMGGLSMDAMLDVIFSGPLNCGLFQMKAPLIREQDFPASFPLKHMSKDFKFVVDTAYDLGAPVPTAHMMLHLFRLAVGKQWGDLDFAAIWKLLEQLGKPQI